MVTQSLLVSLKVWNGIHQAPSLFRVVHAQTRTLTPPPLVDDDSHGQIAGELPDSRGGKAAAQRTDAPARQLRVCKGVYDKRLIGLEL